MLFEVLSSGFFSFGGVRGNVVKAELLVVGFSGLVDELGRELCVIGDGVIGEGIIGIIFFTSLELVAELFKIFVGGVAVDDLDIVLVSADKTFVHGKAQAVLTAQNKTQFRIH
ncbi:MAG: hypothetical protein ACRBCS_05105 [Cellvibrionaceae bacterium]